MFMARRGRVLGSVNLACIGTISDQSLSLSRQLWREANHQLFIFQVGDPILGSIATVHDQLFISDALKVADM